MPNKVVLFGNKGSGKTSFFERVVNKKFPGETVPTIGAGYQRIDMETELWDTADFQKYSNMMHFYAKSANAVLYFFDGNTLSTSLATDINALLTIRSHTPKETPYYYIISKSDTHPKNEMENFKKRIEDALAKEEKLYKNEVILSSAKDNINVESVLENVKNQLTKKASHSEKNKPLLETQVDRTPAHSSSKNSCWCCLPFLKKKSTISDSSKSEVALNTTQYARLN